MRVKQLRAKYNGCASFVLYVPKYLKNKAIDKGFWGTDSSYVREFVQKSRFWMIEFSNLFCVFCVYMYVLISFNLKVASFNCHGVGTSIETIRQLTTEFEIVFLEETWIYSDEFAIVSQISDEMQSFCLSSMSLDEKLLSGRPQGSLSIMEKKSLSNSIKIIQYDDSHILGIELQSNNFTLLFLTVYLPYECDQFYDDYCFYLSKLQCIIDSAKTPYIYILGDFNADIQATSIFGAELIEFCNNNNLCFLDRNFYHLIRLHILVKFTAQLLC